MEFYMVVTTLLSLIYNVNGQSCTTPDGNKGNCVKIFSCPALFELVRLPNIDKNHRELLRKSACGFEGKTPKVCCQSCERNNCPQLCKDCEIKRCLGTESVCCGLISNTDVGTVNCTTSVTAFPPNPKGQCCSTDNITENKILNESCTTPDGSKGNCVNIFSCPALVELVRSPNIDNYHRELLRKSACGFEGNTPKVCCPSLCLTPSGEQGQCVNRNNCPQLCKDCEVKRCLGTESVCCGPISNTDVGTVNCTTSVTAFPPNPKGQCCGLDGVSRVTSLYGAGFPTAIDQYPWLAIIEYQKDDRKRSLCGGALISGKYVLTAATCITGPILEQGTPKTVRLAEYDTTTELDCHIIAMKYRACMNATITILVESTTAHPQYDSLARKHDIGLIRLKELAPYTEFISPICLPSSDYTRDLPFLFQLFVAGWGGAGGADYRSTLKTDVRLPYVELEECQKFYNTSQRNITLWNSHMCAGGVPHSYRGDHGGPLMYLTRKAFEVVGVASFRAVTVGTEDVPAVYTKVYDYVDWIYSNIMA